MKRTDLFICAGLLIAILAVYGQVHGFAFLNYDDADSVTRNAHVESGWNADSVEWAVTSTDFANWFPLTRLSHILDVQLFGLDAGAHHLTNVALHALTALLLFFVMKRITATTWPSAFIAFVFAIHPLHVESVAWIAERKDVLSALFWVLTLWAYLRYKDRPNALRYALTILFFLCGLMSKPMIITLPFVLLLIDDWMKRKPAILEKIPLFALSLASAIATFVIQQHGGAVSTFQLVPLPARIANALVAYCAYLAQFIVPINLSVFYPFVRYPIWTVIAAAAILLAITAAVFRRRDLRTGWLWYLGTLVPVIGLIQVGAQSRADRYTYIPLIGISIVIAFAASDLAARKPSLQKPIAAIAILACVAWTVAAYNYTTVWQSSITLFDHATRVTDRNYLAYNNLGDALRSAGRSGDALRNFETAVEIQPAFADAQDNLGETLLARGRLGEAMPHLIEAARLDPKSPEARVNLGTALRDAGRPADAEAQYRAALAIDPDNAEARRGLGNVLAQFGRFAEAIAQYREALRVNPNDADAHYNLGLASAQMGDQNTAIVQFVEVARLQPSSAEARFNLGMALVQANRFEEAAAAFDAAVKLKPDYLRARFNLASALATLERYPEAAREFAAILAADPNFPDARRNLDLCNQLASHAK